MTTQTPKLDSDMAELKRSVTKTPAAVQESSEHIGN
jgi:hypothetical protein